MKTTRTFKTVFSGFSNLKLGPKLVETGIVSLAGKIRTLTQTYHDLFNQTVEAVRVRGVDDQSGLRGELTETVDRFMDDISFLQVDAFYIEVFRLQRYQVEYMLYKKEKIADQIQTSLDRLKKVVEEDQGQNPVKEIRKNDDSRHYPGIVSDSSAKMNDNIRGAAATVQEAAANMTYISKTTEGMNQTIGSIPMSAAS